MWSAATTAVMMAMIVSDQRREEIVRELRYISGHPPEWATSASVMAEFLDVDYTVKWGDSGELFSMLADLVERPTCRDVSKQEGGFECSERGCYADSEAWRCFLSCGSDGETAFSYCPNCGRKVVHENDRPSGQA